MSRLSHFYYSTHSQAEQTRQTTDPTCPLIFHIRFSDASCWRLTAKTLSTGPLSEFSEPSLFRQKRWFLNLADGLLPPVCIWTSVSGYSTRQLVQNKTYEMMLLSSCRLFRISTGSFSCCGVWDSREIAHSNQNGYWWSHLASFPYGQTTCTKNCSHLASFPYGQTTCTKNCSHLIG
jgi:hypothetical protein